MRSFLSSWGMKIFVMAELLKIGSVIAFHSNALSSSRNVLTRTNNQAMFNDVAQLARKGKETTLFLSPEEKNGLENSNADNLAEKFGGFTAKQRLREEVESPFRKVRFLFFLSSVGSAMTALYFSALSTIKAYVGGYADAPPIEEALQSDAINFGGAIVCGYFAYQEYLRGQANLQRIQKGGQLASLVVEPAAISESTSRRTTQKLADYRRISRVLIAAGGKNYVEKLALSLTADQLSDTNIIPQKLQENDLMVVPVLLGKDSEDKIVAFDTSSYWNAIEVDDSSDNRNFDINRANDVISYPLGKPAWTEYLESEIEQAAEQGFDVLEKGITITVKKNGRILRRATGQPPWGDLIGTMEVLDGSKFGMPGDGEKYGDK